MPFTYDTICIERKNQHSALSLKHTYLHYTGPYYVTYVVMSLATHQLTRDIIVADEAS